MSSGIVSGSPPPTYGDDKASNEKNAGISEAGHDLHRSSLDGIKRDSTHRKLKSRHIQLIGIGGTIGTALYVCFEPRLASPLTCLYNVLISTFPR